MKIEGVETALGNKIIDFLRAQRWRKIDEYSSLHVDKGIDFDSYIFESENGRIHLEWTNWDEWTLSGNEKCLSVIRDHFPELS